MRAPAVLSMLIVASLSTTAQAANCQSNVDRLQRVGSVMTLMLSARLGLQTNFNEAVAPKSCILLYDPASDEHRCSSVTMNNTNGLTKDCSIDKFSSVGETRVVSVALTYADKKIWPNLLFTVEDGRVTRVVHAPSPIVLSSGCRLGI